MSCPARWWLAWLSLIPWLILLVPCALATSPPGALIHTQANVSFLDAAGREQYISSNEVITKVQPVTGVRISSDQHLWGLLGDTLVFPHLLTNVGNIPASYELDTETTPVNPPGSLPPVTPSELYIDKDHTGEPLPANKVTGPVHLLPGESINLLIVATVPDLGFTDVILSARIVEPDCPGPASHSGNTRTAAEGRCQARVSNQMSRSLGVVYKARMEMDRAVAYVDDQVQTTISFRRRDGRSYISTLTLTSLLPDALSYIPDSSRLCNYTGENCRAIPDPPISNNQLTYRLDSKTNQHSGQVRFRTDIISGVDQTVYNVTEYTFCEINKDCPRVLQESNFVPLYIKGYGVALNGSPNASTPELAEPVIEPLAVAGSVVTFINYLWNTGTELTTYQLSLAATDSTFPMGTGFCLDTGSGCSGYTALPLSIDIATIEPRNALEVRLRVKLPDTMPAADNRGYTADLKVVDIARPGRVYDGLRNWLLKILPPASEVAVDLTLDRPAGESPPPPGAGSGPETSPVRDYTLEAGGEVVVDNIFVNNTGGRSSSYLLTVVRAQSNPLPPGLQWQFLNTGDQPLAHTLTLPEGGFQQVKLVLRMPADTPPRSGSIVLQARSADTNTEDRLLLALSVPPATRLLLEPAGRASILPGSVTTFTHRLVNQGNTPLTSLRFNLENTLPGWQSLVYQVLNDSNGELSAGPIAGIAVLPPGESVNLVIRVFAPAGVDPATENQTTLTVSQQTSEGVTALAAVTNTTLINDSRVIISKQQAPWDCTGPVPEQFMGSTFPAPPGSCVVYKLTASNQGDEPVRELAIHDLAPDYTGFAMTGGLPLTQGPPASITTRGQEITARWLEAIMPGVSVALVFAIRIQ